MLTLDDPSNSYINGEHATNSGELEDQNRIVNMLTYLS